jgi:hypothetical protein
MPWCLLPFILRGFNVRHNVGKMEAIVCPLKQKSNNKETHTYVQKKIKRYKDEHKQHEQTPETKDEQHGIHKIIGINSDSQPW